MGNISKYAVKVPKFYEANGFQTTRVRSENMARIRNGNTEVEIILRKILWGMGLRYRIHSSKLPGKPDIVLPRHKLIIFIDGGFWHGFDWKNKKHLKKTNKDFWIPKIERNIERDILVNTALSQAGWTVLRFWDHEIKKELRMCVSKILQHIED